MQLGSRFKPRTNRNLVIKIILIFLVFFLGIFLLDKIDFPAPKKLIKQEEDRYSSKTFAGGVNAEGLDIHQVLKQNLVLKPNGKVYLEHMG